ncbi:hypothetical protein [Pseudomonas virus PBPA162]|uniref:Uncharacterized protein n=1 Tax=Pseudomonas virus PBPA162 TaxID=2588096 RepID=A0A4Y5TQM3_9CAUD|nr:hypothetical protein PQC32_gp56 [Pseudomonas virus PBPA162]QDB70890.1 hypothetical protein [Pseudomonas virus PBPA162]
MGTVAQLIKIGMERAILCGELNHMCFRLAEVKDFDEITQKELTLFNSWIRTVLERQPWFGVRGFLNRRNPAVFEEEPHCMVEESNWCNFYVWTYYDLIKKG